MIIRVHSIINYSIVLFLLSNQLLVDSFPRSNRHRRNPADDITISDETITEEQIFETLSNNQTDMFVSEETENTTLATPLVETQTELDINDFKSVEINTLDIESKVRVDSDYNTTASGNDTYFLDRDINRGILNETGYTGFTVMTGYSNPENVFTEMNEFEVENVTTYDQTESLKVNLSKEEPSTESPTNLTTEENLTNQLGQEKTPLTKEDVDKHNESEETVVSVEEGEFEVKDVDDEENEVKEEDNEVDEEDDEVDEEEDEVDEEDDEVNEPDDEVSDETEDNNIFRSHSDMNKTLKVEPKFNQTIKHIQKEIRMFADCPDVSCEFGYQTDLNGKTLCKCYNPCSENKCGSKICVIEKINEKYQGICIDPKKIDRPVKCYLPVEKGRCRNYVSRFYYNSFYQECTHFVFRGCQGNANNFNTWSECNTECNVCSQPPDSGPCRSHNIRYYYDSSSQSCVPFNYGGCHGNKNNFISKKLCEDTC